MNCFGAESILPTTRHLVSNASEAHTKHIVITTLVFVYLQHSPLLTASYTFHALYFHKPGYPPASNAAVSAISSSLFSMANILKKLLGYVRRDSRKVAITENGNKISNSTAYSSVYDWGFH